MSRSDAVRELPGEVQALLTSLRTAEARLREITGGQVDAITDLDGGTFLLQTAQDSVRRQDLDRRAAILNCLPANIALLDADGFIVAVNESWRRFGDGHGLRPGAGDVGSNYLDACLEAHGDHCQGATWIADGLASVLSGASPAFDAEYPCHSPSQRRWFQMTTTPLSATRRDGVVVMHVDVTARKLNEVALQASEAEHRETAGLLENERSRLVEAQEVAKIGSWETDLPTKQRIWSAETYRIYEMDPGVVPVTEAQFLALVHPEDRAGVAGELEALPESGRLSMMRHRLLFPDGRVKYIEERWHLHPVVDGQPLRLLGTCQDITEPHLAELALAELSLKTERRERILSTTLSSINDFAYIYDREGRFLFANQPLLDLLGLTLEQIVGRNFDDLGYPEALAQRLQQQIEQVFGNGESLTDETPFTAPDGKPGFYEYIFSAVQAADGSVEFVVGTTRDITERKLAEEALRSSVAEQRESARLLSIERSRLQDAQRVSKIGSWETNLATMDVLWSDEMRRILEVDPGEEGSHDGFLQKVHPDDRARLDREFRESLVSRDPQVTEHRLLLDGNRIAYVEARWLVVFDPQGVAERVVGTTQDISERKLAGIRIERLNRGYLVLSQINSLIVRASSREELFQEACRIAVEAGLFPLAWIGVVDAAGQRVIPVASFGADGEFLDHIGERLSFAADAPLGYGPTAVAVREKRCVVVSDVATDPVIRDGRVHVDRGIRSLVSQPLIVAGEVLAVLVLHASDVDYFDAAELDLLSDLAGDIAFAIDHIGKAEQLNFVAYYDALTGLANRSLFVERARQCLRSAGVAGHGAAMVLLDLEHFKDFNDSFGQAAGDELLRLVGAWLAANLADASLLARVGPDIFALMLVDSPQPGEAARQLDTLIHALHEHPFELAGGKFRIAGKFGVALAPEDAAEVESLFLKAESALKGAKAGGHRQLFYTQKMTETVAKRLGLENQLRHALDNEEFVLHYQPKVVLRSGNVCGAEALIRWNDPRTGLVPPFQFISILEETGLIHEVGRWALRQALGDYLRWRDAGLPAPRIAVNVSALQLRDAGFVASVRRLLEVDEFAAEGLELEITESMIMADIDQSIASLQALRDMAVRVAIDDFGTGFSSLGYLSKLPVDSLKIDRSFVDDMTRSPEGLSLVSTIITLAHSLHLEVVAEGVETEEQCGLLKLLRCDEMQGYLFSKPVPADEFESRFLRSA